MSSFKVSGQAILTFNF